eukprot:EG_transcript_4315
MLKCAACWQVLPTSAFRAAKVYELRKGRAKADKLRCKSCNSNKTDTRKPAAGVEGRDPPRRAEKRKDAGASEAPPSKAAKAKDGQSAAEAAGGRNGFVNKETIELNRALADHARRKELRQAMDLFQAACGRGLANGVTYSTAINALVRCGKVAEAGRLLNQMKSDGLKPCVVTYSTYLKGLCATGDMEAAAAVLAEMDAAGVPPNLRTINTYLRGCLMHGAVQDGIACFTQLRPRWALEPDASAFGSAVQLLGQGLRLGDARCVARRMQKSAGVPPHSLAHAFLCVAQAAVLCGDRPLAEKYLRRAAAALDASAGQDAETLDAAAPATGGGQRAWGKKVDDPARLLSLQTYVTHRVDSLRREVTALLEYVAAHEPLPPPTKYLHRVLPFGPRVAAADPVPGLLRNLTDAFGLRLEGEGEAAVGGACISDLKLRRAVQPGGVLDFTRFFSDRRLPLRWEVCSGVGEWAAAQAAADAGRANWLAAELRYDRSRAALLHTMTGGVKNLALVVGDAAAVFRSHVAPGTAQHIFVMHPEPPQQLGAGAARRSEADHLLTPAFVRSLGRALQAGGWLLVVTDSLWYGKLLWEDFADLCGTAEGLEPFQPEGRHSYRVECKKAGKQPLCLFAGSPGEDCGIPNPTALSYFQRLKAKEKAARRQRADAERYFLGLRRRPVPGDGGGGDPSADP